MTSVGVGLKADCDAPKGFLATDSKARTFLLGLSLIVATVAIYYPVHQHPFFYPDDGIYIVENPLVQKSLDWQTVSWALRSARSYWHPVTWLSHAVDCQFFGINPAGHHDMNIVFHALDALVLFWVLRGATGYTGRSFMVAALFAVHPINVEAVAWIAERKTLLCTLFCLLTLAAYRWYAREPKNDVRYGLVALLFLFALMSKPLALVLPFVLLLWDYWPLRRLLPAAPDSSDGVASPTLYPARSFLALVKEKIPLLLLCAFNVWRTVKSQGVLSAPPLWSHPLSIRVGNAIVAYVRYMGKAIWPFGLAVFYPHPGTSLRAWQVLASLAVLLAITALVAANWRRRYLTVGWLWFLGVLVPNIGLMQLGEQALADRYAYLSFLGLFLMMCWSVAELAEQRRLAETWVPAFSAALLLALVVIAHRQVEIWNDDITLWTHDLQVTADNAVAECRLGYELMNHGKTDEAMPRFYRALALSPDKAAASMGIALCQRSRGNLPAAISYYERALATPDPDFHIQRAQALANLGYAYRDVGELAKADECFKQAAASEIQSQNERNQW